MTEHHDALMGTTLTLDADVVEKARLCAARLGKPFREIVNEALRVGLGAALAPPVAKSYQTQPTPMGLRVGFSYHNIDDLLARIEGEDHA